MAVALTGSVDFLKRAGMECPQCHERVEPLEGSTPVVAWYSCARCGHFWSARLRDGRPVPESTDQGPLSSLNL